MGGQIGGSNLAVGIIGSEMEKSILPSGFTFRKTLFAKGW